MPSALGDTEETPGAVARPEAAIACHPAVMEYIKQGADEVVSLDDAVAELTGVFGDA